MTLFFSPHNRSFSSLFLWAALLTATILPGSVLAQQLIRVKVALTPAGSFEALSTNVQGKIKKRPNTNIWEIALPGRLMVPVSSLSSGITLRDEHLQKKLAASTNGVIIVQKAQGENNKGKALLEINGLKDFVDFTYEISGNKMLVRFPVSLSKYQITGINYNGLGVCDTVNIEAQLDIGE